MNKKMKVQIVIAMGIVLNVLGAFIAMSFSIPFYMDSIGTILVAGLLGPKYAMLTGVLGSLTSGMTFDMYSFYYAPVQLLTGFFAGILYHGPWLKGWKTFIGSILVGIPTSIASAIITAMLFRGITSGSSSAIVVVLNHLGLNLVFSILIVQIFTDYTDKLLAVMLTKMIIERGHLYEKWGIPWKDTVILPTKSKEKLYS
ncbi:MAG: ECF transporter S component [Coprobacillus cateniformis]|nr:ECF transporter S component [Coprobacillus cateniformis]